MVTAAPRVAAPGTMLAGKLRVERLIGEGAMGVVYEATDIALRRRVAVKLVHPDYVDDYEKRRRFGREAFAVARLESAHVTRVLEISELDDGTPFLVMELLEGRTLDRVLEEDGPVAVDVALDWTLQALDALAEAHAIGLVHRDFKPANLFLAYGHDRVPILKVLDFGLVKDMNAKATKLTAEGSTMGSPAYMAPEQVSADGVIDARADVWAAGVTIFELLTRELPFDAPTIPGMLGQILHDPPTPLRVRRPDAPAELEALIAWCLAKDPGARPATAAELASALVSVRAKIPAVTDNTRTVRLAEGAAIPPPRPLASRSADTLDVRKVRPRVPRDQAGAPPAKNAPVAMKEGAPSVLRAIVVTAVVTCAVVSALGYVGFRLLTKGHATVDARPAPSANVSPPASASLPLATAAASVVDPISPPPEPRRIAIDTRTLDEPMKGRWAASAHELEEACAAQARGCARTLSVARASPTRAPSVEAPAGCKVPRDLKTCVEGIVRKNHLTTASSRGEVSKVSLTFP